jgi:hypothetical protein
MAGGVSGSCQLELEHRWKLSGNLPRNVSPNDYPQLAHLVSITTVGNCVQTRILQT